MPEIDAEGANRRLTDAVSAYIDEMGWGNGQLTMTDVMVVAVRRGWDRDGGKSVTGVWVPTDTSVPTALGMAEYARIRFDLLARKAFYEEDTSAD